MSITIDRAIEILDPKHRECYDDLPDGMEQVQEACRMGQEALIRERDGGDVRHGHWVNSEIPCEDFVCSLCGGAAWYYDYTHTVCKSAYCPNCGAKMDEEVRE